MPAILAVHDGACWPAALSGFRLNEAHKSASEHAALSALPIIYDWLPDLRIDPLATKEAQLSTASSQWPGSLLLRPLKSTDSVLLDEAESVPPTPLRLPNVTNPVAPLIIQSGLLDAMATETDAAPANKPVRGCTFSTEALGKRKQIHAMDLSFGIESSESNALANQQQSGQAVAAVVDPSRTADGRRSTHHYLRNLRGEKRSSKVAFANAQHEANQVKRSKREGKDSKKTDDKPEPRSISKPCGDDMLQPAVNLNICCEEPNTRMDVLVAVVCRDIHLLEEDASQDNIRTAKQNRTTKAKRSANKRPQPAKSSGLQLTGQPSQRRRPARQLRRQRTSARLLAPHDSFGHHMHCTWQRNPVFQRCVASDSYSRRG
eukprot:scaffold77621_cov48-Prasinocladus_malaysianus.AAC.1